MQMPMMMNNPLMQLIQVMNSGGNPSGLLNAMAQSNPKIAQVMQMVNGKSPDQLKTMCENMCRERGVKPEDIAQSIGLKLPDQNNG